MAVGRSGQILKVAITFSTAVLLTLLLFRALILPLLPPLEVIISQLFVRMRDVLAFLAFTTVIAAGIFSSQHRDAQRNNTAKKPFLDHHPFGSIFGETENARDMAEEDVQALAPAPKQMQTNNSCDATVDYSIERAPAAAMGNGSLLQNRSEKLDTETSRGHEFSASKEAIPEPKLTSLHHRKSTSSLADSMSHGPDDEAIQADRPLPRSSSARSKPSKRVSFSPPSPSKDRAAAMEGGAKQSSEHTHEKQKAVSTGDITMQADAFIAKFKEQMRMQRLESINRRLGVDRK